LLWFLICVFVFGFVLLLLGGFNSVGIDLIVLIFVLFVWFSFGWIDFCARLVCLFLACWRVCLLISCGFGF